VDKVVERTRQMLMLSRGDHPMLSVDPCPNEAHALVAKTRPRVYILDSSPTTRHSMALMIEAHGMVAKSFESARAYREHMPDEAVACLVIDTKLPDADGLDLQQTLSGESAPPPIIFVSDTGDIRYTVRAIKRGAVDFLPKPVEPDALVAAIDLAIAEGARSRERNARATMLTGRYQLLSRRERQVFSLIVSGLRNKQAAWHLGITKVTLQVHRGRIMRKMAAASFADLVRMASLLEIPLFISSPGPSPRGAIGVRGTRSASYRGVQVLTP
jgi:FixJ family two-component response regulator